MAAADDVGDRDREGRALARRGALRKAAIASRAVPAPSEEHLRLRAELMDAVRDVIRRNGLRQSDAALLFGVAQPRVSDLVRGKIELFSIYTLVGMLAAAGVKVDLKLRRGPGIGPTVARSSPRR
jgi:predicted XRE-type DNA-binding protein